MKMFLIVSFLSLGLLLSHAAAVPDPVDAKMIYVCTFGGCIWHGPADGDPEAMEDIVTPIVKTGTLTLMTSPTITCSMPSDGTFPPFKCGLLADSLRICSISGARFREVDLA